MFYLLVCVLPKEAEKDVRTLELESSIAMRHHVGAAN